MDAFAAGARARILRARFEDRGEEGCFLRSGTIWLRSRGREIELQRADRLSLPGAHNLENGMAAAAAAFAAGATPEGIGRSLSRFPGLPHRLELDVNRWRRQPQQQHVCIR